MNAGQVRRRASLASAAGQSPGSPLSRGAEGGTRVERAPDYFNPFLEVLEGRS